MFVESDSRAKLIDPALHFRGWTEHLNRSEESAGAIESPDGARWRRTRGRVDYVLRVRVNPADAERGVGPYWAKAEQLRARPSRPRLDP